MADNPLRSKGYPIRLDGEAPPPPEGWEEWVDEVTNQLTLHTQEIGELENKLVQTEESLNSFKLALENWGSHLTDLNKTVQSVEFVANSSDARSKNNLRSLDVLREVLRDMSSHFRRIARLID